VAKEALETGGEEIVTYMRLMIERSQQKHYPITPAVLKSLAGSRASALQWNMFGD